MLTILLLFVPRVIVVSWLIAFAEYAFQVTLIVFAAFAYLYLGERLRWNYVLSFGFILCAVASAFWGRH